MELDFAHAIRCRTLVVASLAVAVLTLVYVSILLSLDSQMTPQRVGGIAGGFAVALTPALLLWTRNLELSATAFLCVFQSVLIFGAFGTGGIHSNVAPPMLIAPVLAGFLLGWRRALAFVFATLAIYIWLTWQTVGNGLLPTHYPTPEQLAVARGAGLVLAVFAGAASFWGLNVLGRESEARLRRAKEAAEGANNLKSHFIANMGHEIRTPLNGVLGMARILARTPLETEQRQFVQLIERSGLSLLEVVNDLLEISMLETDGAVEEVDEHFDLAWMVRTVTERAEAAAAEKDLQFEAHLPAEIAPHPLAQARRLKRVLTILVDNAVKFTDEGSVHLGCEARANGWIRFRVSDTGPGIAPDEHERVFDRFYQADRSLGRRHGGSGLGLAIAKRIVEAADGKIGVESVPGSGACFWFEVPLQEQTPHTNKTSSPETVAA